jgi:hypothetical protein
MGGQPVDAFGRPCMDLRRAPREDMLIGPSTQFVPDARVGHRFDRPTQPSFGFTTGSIGPFTTGPLSPSTPFAPNRFSHPGH